jgi:hypothetical protein
MDRFDVELADAGPAFRSSIVKSLFSRKARSTAMGDLFAAMMLPAMSAAMQAEERDEANLSLTQIAAALAAYRAQQRAYPAALNDLVPAILPSIPIDRYSGGAPLYHRRGDGYVLYSVFQNGVDDGATDFSGEIVKGEWMSPGQERDAEFEHSDLVIRAPRTRRLSSLVPTLPQPDMDEASVEGGNAAGEGPGVSGMVE